MVWPSSTMIYAMHCKRAVKKIDLYPRNTSLDYDADFAQ